MKAVRFTKAQVDVITEAVQQLLLQGDGVRRYGRVVQDIKAKLEAAEAAPPGVNPGPIETALINASRCKVVPLGGGWPRASKMCTAVGATPEDATLIGKWMAAQGWLRGPQTLLDVLNKWPQWLAKAKATQPPPVALPGFGAGAGDTNGEATDGAARPGEGGPTGRPAPGFGRGR